MTYENANPQLILKPKNLTSRFYINEKIRKHAVHLPAKNHVTIAKVNYLRLVTS